MNMEGRVCVVRPYSRRIRERVFEVLGRAGLDMASAEIIPPRTGDDRCLAQLRGGEWNALLIPFHAHRDSLGSLINGASLVARLRTEVPRLRHVPILMPVSQLGMSSLTLMLARSGATTSALMASPARATSGATPAVGASSWWVHDQRLSVDGLLGRTLVIDEERLDSSRLHLDIADFVARDEEPAARSGVRPRTATTDR